MAKDEQGIDAKARDGAPNGNPENWSDDEIERRRQLKEAREREEEQQVQGKAGRPIDDQPDEQEPMFPVGSIEGDHKVTLKNIVPAGKARKTEAKMGATAVPLLHGLRRYGELVELIVTAEAGSVNEVPDLEASDTSDRRTLKGVKDVQNFRPVHVRSAADLLSIDQVLDILEREFALPRTATKVRKVFGLDGDQAAAAG